MAPRARGISIEVLNDRGLIKRLTAAGGEVDDMRKVHRRIGVKLLQMVLFAFRKERSPEGKKWKGLRPNTIFGRRKKSSRILQDTGALMKSFSFSASRVQVRVGSRDPRSRWHQEGTRPYDIPKGGPKKGVMLVFPVKGGVKIKRKKGTPKKGTVGSGASKTVAFAKSVRHPGLPARPMLPSLRTGRAVADKVTNDYLREVANRANRGRR